MSLLKADPEPGFLRVAVPGFTCPLSGYWMGKVFPFQFTSVDSVYQKLRTVRTGPRMLWAGWIWYNISGFLNFFQNLFSV